MSSSTVIQNSTGSGKLVKSGTGTLTLSGASTYTGGTTLNTGGTLNINSTTAIGTGTLTLSGSGTIDNTSGSSKTLANNNPLTLSGGSLTFTGAGDGTHDLNFGSGTVTISGANRMMTISAGTLTLGGGVTDSGGTRKLTKAGTGTLVLNGAAGTWTGGCEIDTGTLAIGADTALGTGTLTLAGGALQSSGGARSIANVTLLTTSDGTISGSAGFTFNSSGTFTSSPGNRTLTVNNSGTTTLAGNVYLSDDNTTSGRGITFNGTGNVTISAPVANNNAGNTVATTLTYSGSGTLTLSGANTYSGKTTIQNGTLSVSSLNKVTGGSASSSLGAPTTTANGTIGIGATTTAGTLLYSGAGETTDRVLDLAGTTGGATLDQSGSGLLKFTSANTAAGVGAKTLTLQGSTAGSGEIGGALVNSSSGATAVTKAGSGTWTLSGVNTFSGGTTLSAGQLNINSSTALGAAVGAFTISGGTIDNTSAGAITLANNNPQNWNGDFAFTGTKDLNLGTGAVTPNASRQITVNGGNLQVDGAIGGGAVGLTKGGSGTLILGGSSGVNTYSGGTTIKSGQITMRGGSSGTSGALGPNTASVFLGDTTGTAAASLINSFGGPYAYPLTVQSGSSGTKTLSLSPGASLTWSGSITLNDSLTVDTGTGTSGVGLSGNISGSGGITKAGTDAARLILSGVNTFSGGVNLTAGGAIDINSTTALGATAGTFTIGSGTLIDNSSGSPKTLANNNPQNWNGDFTYLGNSTDLNLGTGAVTLNATRQVTVSGNRLTVGGVISGSGFGLTKAGAGALTLSGANTYSGNTTVSAGTLQLGAAGVIPDGVGKGNVSVTGTLDLNTFSETINGLSGAGTVDTVAGGTPTLTAGNNDQTSTFSGIIKNTTGTLALTKTGTGTLTLSGANTYGGATTISAGSLALTGSGSINNTLNVVVSIGAGFDVSGRTGGSYNLTSGQTLKGNGGVKGTIVVVSGATVAPGTSIGALYFTNAPTLSGTTSMEIDRAASPNADKLVVVSGGGQLVYGGTLTVVNNGAALQGGETFDLFDADSFSGSFSTTNLPSLGTGLNWWTNRLTVDGTINVNRAPSAQDKSYTRSKGVSLKIAKADLLAGASDPDSGDSVSYDALPGTGSQGATVTENGTDIFYAPANNNNDTLQYRLKDTRGGTVTKNIQITVVNATGLVQSLSVSGGMATASFAGIPGFSYQIQRSTNLVDWATLETTNAPSAGLFEFTDDFSDLGGAPTSAYYRLRQP